MKTQHYENETGFVDLESLERLVRICRIQTNLVNSLRARPKDKKLLEAASEVHLQLLGEASNRVAFAEQIRDRLRGTAQEEQANIDLLEARRLLKYAQTGDNKP